MFSQPLLRRHIPPSAVCTLCVGRFELFRFVSRCTFFGTLFAGGSVFLRGVFMENRGVYLIGGLGHFLGGRWRRLFFICDFMVLVMEEWGVS